MRSLEADERYIRSHFSYDPITGLFVALGPPKCGQVVGSKRPDGYIQISVNNRNLYAHRVAFFMIHGWWPELIDHIDRNRSNNRIANLRCADKAINSINSKLSIKNTSGLKGVVALSSGRFAAFIGGSQIKRHIGTFDTAEQASAAYRTVVATRYGSDAQGAFE